MSELSGPPRPGSHAASGRRTPREYFDGAPAHWRSAMPWAMRNAFVFRGRASRSSFWKALPFLLLLHVVVALAAAASDAARPIAAAISLYVSVALISLTVRRLHDTGRSGWYALLWLIPFVGLILLPIRLATRGHITPNRFTPGLDQDVHTRVQVAFGTAVIAALVVAGFALLSYADRQRARTPTIAGAEQRCTDPIRANAEDVTNTESVIIDGTRASRAPDGRYTVTGSVTEPRAPFHTYRVRFWYTCVLAWDPKAHEFGEPALTYEDLPSVSDVRAS